MTLPLTARRIATVETIPPLGSRRAATLWLAVTAAAYLCWLTAAAVPDAPVFAMSAAVVCGLEVLCVRYAPFTTWAMQRVGVGPPVRALIRGLALVLFADRALWWWAAVFAAVLMLVTLAAGAGRNGLAQLVDWSRRAPKLSKGLPIEVGAVPPALPSWIAHPRGIDAMVELVAALGLVAAEASGESAWVAVGLGAALVLALAAPAVLAAQLQRLRRQRVRVRVDEAVSRSLYEYAPEVVLYFGNGAEWRYQVEMWLRVLEQVPQRVVVLVRDGQVLRTLAPTRLPIVCIPGADTLMSLELPSALVALYVGNAGNNIHMLRRPGVRTVFIGHGDSDKGSSFNPFSRVYDEIWVAGDAGRARYATADIGINPAAIVAVGRPQLADLPRQPDAVPMLTVLYAPTWEGWGEDPFSSSLPHFGVELIRALLAQPGVRVMYRPHPRTGHRDPEVRRAHDEIVELLTAAGANPSAGRELGPLPSTSSPHGDLLDEVVGQPAPWSRDAHDAAVATWTAQYLAAQPGHRVLTPPAPELHACFAVADALIADVSSVITDFLVTDRPYAVVNATDETNAEFRRRVPSAAGGFILDRGMRDLRGLLAAARGESDPTAVQRAEVRRYMLGPRTNDPTETFRAELQRLCVTTREAKSAAHRMPWPAAADVSDLAGGPPY